MVGTGLYRDWLCRMDKCPFPTIQKGIVMHQSIGENPVKSRRNTSVG
jgi:hypothetical protein